MLLSFIFNMSNVLWGSAMVGTYFALKKLSSMSEEEIEKIKEKILKQQEAISLPLPLIGVIAWIILRCVFALGYQLILEMVLVMGVATYIYRTAERRHLILVNQAQLALQNTTNYKSILGDNLPEWLTNPSASRVVWLNTMMAGLWTSIAGATEESIRQTIPSILQQYKPSFINEFVLKSCSIGTRPMAITAIEHHSNVESASVLDLTFTWDSDMDFALLIKVPGPDMLVNIRRFELSMKLRVIFEPHTSQWPCFGAVSISIMKIWVLNFDISAVKLPLDAVPGLGSFLDSFIRNTLIGFMRYPKKLTFPILKDIQVKNDRADSALGALRISLLRVEEWQARYFKERQNTPYYVKVTLLDDQNKKRLRSQEYKGLNSALLDRFSFVLYDLSLSLRFWIYFDVPGSDVLVGECDYPLKPLVQQKGVEHEIILTKVTSDEKTPRAKLVISAEFLPYASKANHTTAPPSATPSRMVSGEFVRDASLLVPPSTRSLSNASLTSRQNESGTLFVTVVKCTGLKNVQFIGKSDPYVQLRLRHQTKTSQYVDDSLDPVFNFETEFDVYDVRVDVLKVSVLDKNVGKDKFMASVDFPVQSITEQIGGFMKVNLNLEPQGHIFMEMRLMQH